MSSQILIHPLDHAKGQGIRFSLLGPVFSQDIDDLGRLLHEAIRNQHSRIELDLTQADPHLIKPRRLISLWDSFKRMSIENGLDVELALDLTEEQSSNYIWERPSQEVCEGCSNSENFVVGRWFACIPSLVFGVAFLYVILWVEWEWKNVLGYSIGVLLLESIVIASRAVNGGRQA